MGSGDRTALVRICDLAGRPRGTGFVADAVGTVVTSHEAVDGLVRLVLHAPGERTCLADGDAIVPLPEVGLALVRTEGLDVRPLPVSPRDSPEAGTYVRIAAHGWRQARLLGTVPATYTATDRFHLLDTVVELAIGTGGSDALRLGGEAAGGPVLDAATGAVLGVVGTALHTEHRAAGLALSLRAAAAWYPGGPIAALLR
ncbi:trypsin-like peptidase domain-containing protein, partial [Streptomyces niveus]|uniref:trypsin-like peptidase domain-containing protein n=1 Tax=Streptomyces niveus TaxID=193462 RepID=UPI0036CA2175